MIKPKYQPSARNARHLVLAGAVLMALCQASAVAEEARIEPFMPGSILEEITVSAERIELAQAGNSRLILDKEMRQFNRDNIGDALNLLPGVTLSANSRNEKTISVRGFDAREVPLFIDGIPVYIPYDGYVDFNRFTTQDLAAIQVAKGFSSIAYGPNTLGGAINLVSRKPVKVFEGNLSAGFGSGNERKIAANMGSNQEQWYLQAGLAYLQSDDFPLSSDFKPTPTENGGKRNNAYRRDSKQSLKIGLTPNASDEYSLSYYRQEGQKGQPPSTDPAYARYWKWPDWDKESLYFISNTALGDTEVLKIRLYHDRFDNEVDSYSDDSYTSLKTSGKGSVGTGRSIYEDRTTGASLELESRYVDAHTLRLVSHLKIDEHQEFDATGSKNTDHEDKLLSFGVEDSIKLAEAWSLSLGAARHELRPQNVYSKGNAYTRPDKSTASDAQLAVFFDQSETARFYATIAKKTRLPSLKDRYSQRLGTFIENPDLQAEESINYEIGYQGNPWQDGKAEVAIFYSDISDKIQSVADVQGTLKQMQNVGEVRSSGFELGISNAVSSWLELGGNYTYIDLENVSDSKTRLTDVPRNKLTAHALLRPATAVDVIVFAEHNSERWASDTVELSGFTTVSLKMVYRLQKDISIDAGISNLSDKNYSLADGFPSPGRMWFANANYQF